MSKTLFQRRFPEKGIPKMLFRQGIPKTVDVPQLYALLHQMGQKISDEEMLMKKRGPALNIPVQWH